MSIKKKFVQGAIWNSISQFGSQLLNFVFTVILARLLSPADFGVVGQVAVFLGLLSYFSEFGFAPTLIQKKDVDETDLSTAFWGMVFFSIVIYCMVYFLAPLVAVFYDNGQLTFITRIIFLQFLIVPFSMVNEVLENKVLNYARIAKAELSSLVISGTIGIAFAYAGFGIWSLIYQALAKMALRAAILVGLTEWRPKFIFSFSRFKFFVRSGAHFTYRNLVLYFSENTDYLLIGKLAGASMLGIYTMAFRISNYPFTKIQSVFGQMLFPAFNLMENDREKMKSNYFKMSNFAGLVLVPLLITIYFGIDPFVAVVLGEKWAASSVIVKILVFYLVFSSVSFADDPLMITLKRLKFINLVKTVISLLLLGIGFAATLNYGAVGMAATFASVSFIYTVIIKFSLLKELGISLGRYCAEMRYVIIAGAGYALIAGAYAFLMPYATDSGLLFLIGEGCIFAAFILAVLMLKGIIDIRARKINLDAL